jgi:transcription initiation factor TFIIIB Brf1 subunit/transcription initiation factor TFIIB
MSFFKKKTNINDVEYQQIVDSISYLCSKLNYSFEVQNRAIEIIKDVFKKKKLPSDKPAENAAAAIYISCIIVGSPKRMDEFEDEFDSELVHKIVEVAGITEAAFKQYYIKIAETVDIDIILPPRI